MRKLWGAAALVAIIILGGAILREISARPKIAFVRSQDLIHQYSGMKEVLSTYENKTAQWQKEVDILRGNYLEAKEHYHKNIASLENDERKRLEQQLIEQEIRLKEYSEDFSQRAAKEKEMLMKGALNQINSFVEDYAKKQGFDIVLGVTISGNVMYGEDHLDITEQVVNALNQSYQP